LIAHAVNNQGPVMYLEPTSESYLEGRCLMLVLWSSWLLFISRWQTFSAKLSRCLKLCFWIRPVGLHLLRALQSVLHLTLVTIHKIHED